ncbi:MAG: phage tail protein [Pseudomonadota bacterium]|nr:phage tail protein [Pseudomonadota bacterium]
MAQALPYVGAAVGSFFGPMGSQVGFMLGSLASSAIDPQRIEGPRMDDLRVQSATYGRPLPALYGAQRIAGNLIWAKSLKEVKHEERAGKGGPVTSTYSYYANAAIAICEGPIAGIRRIWADGKILYDSSATSTTVAAGGSSPFDGIPLFGDPTNEPTQSLPQLSIRKFTCGALNWGISGNSVLNQDSLNTAWSLAYPEGYVFYGNSSVLRAIKAFLLRFGIQTPVEYWKVEYNWGYLTVSRFQDQPADDPTTWGTGQLHNAHISMAITDISAPGDCPDGYQFNPVTLTCDPIIASSVDGATYKLIADGSPRKASGPVGGSLALTPSITLYHGGESQLPDPNIESALGVGNVPAYRGTAYIVLNDLPVDDYGRRLPNLEFEVLSKGATANVSQVVQGQSLGRLTTGWAYDSARGVLWSVAPGDGVMLDYTRLEVSSASTLIGKLSSPLSNGFTCAGLLRYDAGTDGLWAVGKVAGATCYALISPDSGTVIKVLTPSLALPQNLGGFGIDTTRQVFWSVGRGEDGALFVHAVDMTTGAAVLVETLDDGSTQDYSAVNGNVNSVEYQEKADLMWLGYKAVAKAGGLATFHLRTYRGSTQTMTQAMSLSGQPWFLAEPATSNMWWYDGAAVLLNDPTLRTSQLVSTTPVAGACADGTGSVGLVVKSVPNSVASFDATGAFNGNIVLSASDDLFHLGLDVFADRARGLLVSGAGYTLVNRFGDGVVTVADVFLDLARRLNVPASSIDVSDVAGADCQVQGFGILNRVPARSAFEPLMRAYGLDVVDTGNKVRVARRANAPFYGVIPVADMAAHEDTGSNEYVAPLARVRAHDLELPSVVEVAFDNPAMEYRKDVRRANKLASPSSVDLQTVGLPLVMAAERAEAIAGMLLSTAWLGRETFELTVGMKHIGIDPGDIVDLEDGSGGFERAIVARVAFSPNGTIQLSATKFDYSVYTSLAGVPVKSQVVSPAITSNQAPRLLLLDMPLVNSTDDSSGFYAAVLPAAGQLAFSSATIFTSSDGSNYSLLASANSAATAGVALDALEPTSEGDWDMSSSLTINLFSGSLYSVTDAEILNGANLAVIGKEIIQFANATQNEDGSYTLHKFLRARKGTEWAMVHGGGETLVLLNSVQRVQLPINLNGVFRFYKVVGPGQSIDEAKAVQFTNTDVCLMPYSPEDGAGSRDGAHNAAFSWTRRSRIAAAPLANGFLPLGEAFEAYEIDVLGSTGQVVRTLKCTAPTVAYEAALQIADFGGTPGSLSVNVYQMSASIGRGFPLKITV